MPRTRRMDVGEVIYHVLNRANARVQLFESPKDYLLFEKTLAEAKRKVAVRILAYCIMPNHFHLVLCTKNDGDLSKFMTYLTLTHAQRWQPRVGRLEMVMCIKVDISLFPYKVTSIFWKHVDMSSVTL